MDFGGIVAWECHDTSFVATVVFEYAKWLYQWNGQMIVDRFIWISLVRWTHELFFGDAPYCACQIFLNGGRNLWQNPQYELGYGYPPTIARIGNVSKHSVGNLAYSENTNEVYYCKKNRLPPSIYSDWAGVQPAQAWTSNKYYRTGEQVMGTDGLHYAARTNFTSTAPDRPISGASWWNYNNWWNVVNYVYYGSGVDVVLGTDGYYYACKILHTGQSMNQPVTGASYRDFWNTGIRFMDWSGTTTYNYNNLVAYNGIVFQSRQSGNINHPPEPNNPLDWWWSITDYKIKPWAAGTRYSHILSRVLGTDGNYYRCIYPHYPYDNTRPVSGADWSNYWQLEGKPNHPEVDPYWQEYWRKLKCSLLFDEGVYFLNTWERNNVYGIWGKAEISDNVPQFDPWQWPFSYKVSDMVRGSDDKVYACEIAHASTIDDAPITGVNWDDYWILAECSS